MECDLCNAKTEETFLGKLKGTCVMIKEDNKNKAYYACPECQKRFKDRLKGEIEIKVR